MKSWIGLLFCLFVVVHNKCVNSNSVSFPAEMVSGWFQSSASVAEELVRPLQLSVGSMRILELGAGMGAVTHRIINLMKIKPALYKYHLDVIEINPLYVEHLKERFPRDVHENVSVICADAASYSPATTYDIIICTIPLLSMGLEELLMLLDNLVMLSHEGTYVSFIEYMGFTNFWLLFQTHKTKQIFEQKRAAIQYFKERYLLITKDVYHNLPPLSVHHLYIRR